MAVANVLLSPYTAGDVSAEERAYPVPVLRESAALTKERADLDDWCKQIAPSTELRKWYDHDPERFEEFGHRYRSELDEPERAEALTHLLELTERRVVTLLTASRAVGISEAAVLAELLRR